MPLPAGRVGWTLGTDRPPEVVISAPSKEETSNENATSTSKRGGACNPNTIAYCLASGCVPLQITEINPTTELSK